MNKVDEKKKEFKEEKEEKEEKDKIIKFINKCDGYIYLIRISPHHPFPVYKLGFTTNFLTRYGNYKNTQPSIEFVFKFEIETINNIKHIHETNLLRIFKKNFKQLLDFGIEYFTGDINQMKKELSKYFIEHI